jgi:acetolactate synthase small subunit
VLAPSPDSFVVELTASEAEVNQFVHDLGERTEIVEVVRSGALVVGRSARALHVVR